MAAVERYRDLAREIAGRPARLGAVRLIAVDGGTGAGKTVFAGRLGGALRDAGLLTEVLHTDDLLDGWADQFTFWPRLRSAILDRLAAGDPGRYRRYDWVTRRFAEEHVLPVPDALIMEGVSAARAEVRPRLTLALFVTADPGSRLSRVLDRDGVDVEPELRRWMAAEEVHFARDRTPERADVLVDGDSRVRHDPDSEYVRLR